MNNTQLMLFWRMFLFVIISINYFVYLQNLLPQHPNQQYYYQHTLPNPYSPPNYPQNNFGCGNSPPGTPCNFYGNYPFYQNLGGIGQQKYCGSLICQPTQYCLICQNPYGMTFEQKCLNQQCPNNYFCVLNQYKQPYCQKLGGISFNYGYNNGGGGIKGGKSISTNSGNNPSTSIQ
uniref:Uncharacterized protein n=1 Tax=Meloidogyne enterolobii TaxID=390850 RepID=A0A6V7VZ29_MELEN|nr:unnamed protein product [Meloidogyne enterolobii]